MGLDMYLKGTRHLSRNEGAEIKNNIKEKIDINFDVSEISIQAMYWRKANQIHSWFVENVQNGVDDCENYYVSHDMLRSLLAACRTALDQKNSDVLPPMEGFFFGGLTIDDVYWHDIAITAAGIEKILEKLGNEWYFEYQSSW